MRAMSVKRRKEQPARRKVVLAVFERDYGCQYSVYLKRAQEAGVDLQHCKMPLAHCAGPLDPHEIIPRSAWAAGYLVLSNVVAVCRRHHDWIGEHPGKEDGPHLIGLHGYSYERPDAPVKSQVAEDAA